MWKTPASGTAFEPWFRAAEKRNNLPVGLLSRIAHQESRYNPIAKNPSGATGLMQIIPRWHPGVDATDPVDSILYAAIFLASLYKKFKSWDKAIAAYNWGAGNVHKAVTNHVDWLATAPKETQLYVQGVMNDALS